MKTKKIWLKTILPTITLPIVTALTATSCNWFAFPINPPKPSKNPTIKKENAEGFSDKKVISAKKSIRPEIKDFKNIEFYMGDKNLANHDGTLCANVKNWLDFQVPGFFYYGIYLKTLISGKYLKENLNETDLLSINTRKERLINELKYFENKKFEVLDNKEEVEKNHKSPTYIYKNYIECVDALGYFMENYKDPDLKWKKEDLFLSDINFCIETSFSKKTWPNLTKDEFINFFKDNAVRFYDRLNNKYGYSINYESTHGKLSSLNSKQIQALDKIYLMMEEATRAFYRVKHFENLCKPYNTIGNQINLYVSMINLFKNLYNLKIDTNKTLKEQLQDLKPEVLRALEKSKNALNKLLPIIDSGFGSWNWKAYTNIAFQHKADKLFGSKELSKDAPLYWLFEAQNEEWDHSQAKFIANEVMYYLKEFLLPLSKLLEVKYNLEYDIWEKIDFLYDVAKLDARTLTKFEQKNKPINYASATDEELINKFKQLQDTYKIFGDVSSSDLKIK
ncbi:Uncharacterised protein (plasmid) [Mesomycoplasma conjunctivae]|nr:Uncharacterised protein [Mycoplasmopsis fermentans]VEU67614.1 Uncharacterised protein [Mesomycoplasma conjunctivae]